MVEAELKTSLQLPSLPGMYLEGTCGDSDCKMYKKSVFVHIGINSTFDFFEQRKLAACGL